MDEFDGNIPSDEAFERHGSKQVEDRVHRAYRLMAIAPRAMQQGECDWTTRAQGFEPFLWIKTSNGSSNKTSNTDLPMF